LLSMSEETRERIMRRAGAQEIASKALARDELFTLMADGFTKVKAGMTTVAEVMRALTA